MTGTEEMSWMLVNVMEAKTHGWKPESAYGNRLTLTQMEEQ
jgi:hypothetical protein